MKLACTFAPGVRDTDRLLFSVAQKLQEQGRRVCGTVQVNSGQADLGPCDMDVMVLPDGPQLRISQNLGKASRGCRLDPQALETAVSHVGASLRAGADCLIINKFGKQEAEGRGFRDVIVEALGLGIPVLVGLGRLNQEAFEDFSGGMAVALPPDARTLAAWLQDDAADLEMAI